MAISSHSIRWLLLVLFAFASHLCSVGESCPPSQVTSSNLQKLAMANNYLALNLHRSLSAGSTENVFFSPLSISIIFGLLFYGARGDTAEELRQVLGYSYLGLSDEAVHSSFRCLLSSVSNYPDPSYVLSLHTATLIDSHFQLLPNYVNNAHAIYKSLTEVADFRGNSEHVKKVVNDWVRRNTNGKVDKLLDVLNPDIAMIVLNAVYFKGEWRNKFDLKKTRLRTFYNRGLEAKQVPTMRLKAKFNFIGTDEFQVLELPYAGQSNLSMVILLPSVNIGLIALENTLNLQRLAEIREYLREETVLVELPRFSLQNSRELSTTTNGLGIRKIFYSGQADFSGMSPSMNVFVSRIVHKAFVEVNEEGSEAAAVTGIKMTSRSSKLGKKFVTNRPFVFYIVRNDIILFMGRVVSI